MKESRRREKGNRNAGFRIEFGVKRRPPRSGTCQPFHSCPTSVPFYEFITRAILTYALHLRFTRTTTYTIHERRAVEHHVYFRMKVEIVRSRRILDGFTYSILLIVRCLPFLLFNIRPPGGERWAFDAQVFPGTFPETRFN